MITQQFSALSGVSVQLSGCVSAVSLEASFSSPPNPWRDRTRQQAVTESSGDAGVVAARSAIYPQITGIPSITRRHHHQPRWQSNLVENNRREAESTKDPQVLEEEKMPPMQPVRSQHRHEETSLTALRAMD